MFNVEIIRQIGIISENKNYSKEINLVSWKGKEPVYDLRTWNNSETGKQPLKGITLNEIEIKTLKEILDEYEKQ